MNKLDHHTIRMAENETMENVVQEVNHADEMKPIIRNEVNVIVPEIVTVKMIAKSIEDRKTERNDVVVGRRIGVAEVDQRIESVEVVQKRDVAANQKNADAVDQKIAGEVDHEVVMLLTVGVSQNHHVAAHQDVVHDHRLPRSIVHHLRVPSVVAEHHRMVWVIVRRRKI